MFDCYQDDSVCPHNIFVTTDNYMVLDREVININPKIVYMPMTNVCHGEMMQKRFR
jgi:hypothetical protein